jgi:biotin carboxylase
VKSKVLILNLGWEQKPLIEALLESERNFELYGVHDNNRIGLKKKFREVLICDMRDVVQILKFADRIKPDAVISDECDYSLFVQALLCERYKLPGPSVLAAQISNNKLLQRKIANKKKILVPDYLECYCTDDVLKFSANAGWPIIVKPNDNRGSFGVSVARSESEVEAAFIRALSNSHSRIVLAERYIFGQHLSIDGYCSPGNRPFTLALACNTKTDNGKGVINESILYPGNLEKDKYLEAWNLAEKIANLYGYNFGLFHGEFILEKDTQKIFLTEMSNRGGGVHISNICVPHVSGFNVYKNYINNVLGDYFLTNWNKVASRQLNIKFFYNANIVGKKFDNLCQLETSITTPSLLKVKFFDPRNGIFESTCEGVSRHGMIIVEANTGEDIQVLTMNAQNQLFNQINKLDG